MRTLRGFAHIAIMLTAQTATSWIAVGLSNKAVGAEAKIQTEQKTAPTIQELEQGISDRLKRVEEFRFIEQEATKLGVRAYLFGGTAAGYAHYVKWDLQREKGDSRFQKDRFDYDYTNIYRSTQDLDIVIDGNPDQANKLQQALQQKYPHLQGNKTAWEVRLLTQDMGDKQAILNNPDFMNQHTDSNSTGMIEITKPKNGEHVVRDVRDWNAKEPYFLKDVHDGMLHYYFSPLHETTKFAKEGRNPPILSAIRFLTKAFQYELQIRPEDLASIKKIIQDFDPKETAKNTYVAKWIEKNGKKLIQNAVNIEYARNTLDQLGLRGKLQSITGDIDKSESLAWWMNKEPLRTQPVGEGTGKTAKELGLDIVAHETNNFLAYESITRAHTGDPNVLISRNGAAGEVAVHGDGFYTKTGKEGARGTGLTIRFHLDPDAREGRDFEYLPNQDYVVIKNKAALKVIPESLNIRPVEYFRMLAENSTGAQGSDRGIFEKLKRRISAKIHTLTTQERNEILEIVRSHIKNSPKLEYNGVLSEWFSLPIATKYPDIIEAVLANESLAMEFIAKGLSQPHWVNHPELVERFLEVKPMQQAITQSILTQPHWKERAVSAKWVERLMETGTADENIARGVLSSPLWKDHPEWLEKLIERGNANFAIVYFVFDKPQWQKHPELVEKLLNAGTADVWIAQAMLGKPEWKNHPEWVEKLIERGTADTTLAAYTLSAAHWANRPEFVEKLLKKGTADREIATYVLKKPYWKDHPELLEQLIEKSTEKLDGEIAKEVLSQPHWKDHPELVEKLLKKGTADGSVAFYVLNQPHWKENPELRRLAGGQDPTVTSLKEAFARGETVQISPRTCVLQRLTEGLHK